MTTPTGPTTAEMLAGRVGIRAGTVRFDVIDAATFEPAGTLQRIKPTRRGPEITVDTARSLIRTMRGVRIDWREAQYLNLFRHRIRPTWRFSNGDERPLGVFMFGQPDWLVHSRGRDLVCSMVDQGGMLDQADGTVAAWPAGFNIGAAVAVEWAGVPFPLPPIVDVTTAQLPELVAFGPNVTRRRRIAILSALGNLLPPYFDYAGQGRSRTAPDPALVVPTIEYKPGTTVYRDSPVETNDQLDAPNRYIVTGGGSADVPIIGTYDVPDDREWSIASIGYVKGRETSIAGITDSTQAAAIAAGLAAADGGGFEYAEFDAAPNPFHDTFDVVGWGDRNWLETKWTLPLLEGSDHHHTLRRVA